MKAVTLFSVVLAATLCCTACTAPDPVAEPANDEAAEPVAAPAMAEPESDTWLYGKWQLWYDPEGSPTDWIIFSADGTAVNTSAEGRDISGRYSVEGDKVKIIFKVGSKSMPIELRIAKDKSKLYNYSERTGSSAEYIKVQ